MNYMYLKVCSSWIKSIHRYRWNEVIQLTKHLQVLLNVSLVHHWPIWFKTGCRVSRFDSQFRKLIADVDIMDFRLLVRNLLFLKPIIFIIKYVLKVHNINMRLYRCANMIKTPFSLSCSNNCFVTRLSKLLQQIAKPRIDNGHNVTEITILNLFYRYWIKYIICFNTTKYLNHVYGWLTASDTIQEGKNQGPWSSRNGKQKNQVKYLWVLKNELPVWNSRTIDENKKMCNLFLP